MEVARVSKNRIVEICMGKFGERVEVVGDQLFTNLEDKQAWKKHCEAYLTALGDGTVQDPFSYFANRSFQVLDNLYQKAQRMCTNISKEWVLTHPINEPFHFDYEPMDDEQYNNWLNIYLPKGDSFGISKQDLRPFFDIEKARKTYHLRHEFFSEYNQKDLLAVECKLLNPTLSKEEIRSIVNTIPYSTCIDADVFTLSLLDFGIRSLGPKNVVVVPASSANVTQLVMYLNEVRNYLPISAGYAGVPQALLNKKYDVDILSAKLTVARSAFNLAKGGKLKVKKDSNGRFFIVNSLKPCSISDAELFVRYATQKKGTSLVKEEFKQFCKKEKHLASLYFTNMGPYVAMDSGTKLSHYYSKKLIKIATMNKQFQKNIRAASSVNDCERIENESEAYAQCEYEYNDVGLKTGEKLLRNVERFFFPSLFKMKELRRNCQVYYKSRRYQNLLYQGIEKYFFRAQEEYGEANEVEER